LGDCKGRLWMQKARLWMQKALKGWSLERTSHRIDPDNENQQVEFDFKNREVVMSIKLLLVSDGQHAPTSARFEGCLMDNMLPT
jgi:hypothetical protein